MPYLDEIVFLFVPSADAQVLRFQSGETDMISRLGADNFSVLSRQASDYAMKDAGPGLEYNFLFFNLNELGEKASAETAHQQNWVRSEKFRQAGSMAAECDRNLPVVCSGCRA